MKWWPSAQSHQPTFLLGHSHRTTNKPYESGKSRTLAKPCTITVAVLLSKQSQGCNPTLLPRFVYWWLVTHALHARHPSPHCLFLRQPIKRKGKVEDTLSRQKDDLSLKYVVLCAIWFIPIITLLFKGDEKSGPLELIRNSAIYHKAKNIINY